MVLVEDGKYDVVCVSPTTIGAATVTDVVWATTTVHPTVTSVEVVAPPVCTIVGWNNNTEAVNLGGGASVGYNMGYTLFQGDEPIAYPKYGNDDPCAYHPAMLDSPLPYVIEWYAEGCVPSIEACMINYGSQTGVYGTARDDATDEILVNDDNYFCYVEFYC